MLRARTRLHSLAVLAATGGVPLWAFACPDCPSSEVVNASVFDGRFWARLVFVVLPLIVLAVFAAVLHRLDLASRRESPAELSGKQ